MNNRRGDIFHFNGDVDQRRYERKSRRATLQRGSDRFLRHPAAGHGRPALGALVHDGFGSCDVQQNDAVRLRTPVNNFE